MNTQIDPRWDPPGVVLQLQDVTLQVPRRTLLTETTMSVGAGECVAVMGPSGAGKTSLLNCVAGVTRPTSGTVVVEGTDIFELRATARAGFRLRNMGVVFQFAELLPELTASENVAFQSRLMGMSRGDAEQRADEWLERFGVSQQARSYPDEMSGGEQQRVGLARALAHRPAVVLADEPTGMLDESNTRRVVELLIETAKELGTAVVVATHDSWVAAQADRTLRLQDAQLIPVGAE